MTRVRWVTAFVDVPTDAFEASAAFWCEVTGSALSARRGDRGQFATFLPADGDAYFRIQATDDGSAGVHLDLHTDHPRGLADRAIELGATETADLGDLLLLRSPGGLPFCAVRHHGEHRRPAPLVASGLPDSILDQVCIDCPGDRLDREVDFWAAVTGWPIVGASHHEFRVLDRPEGIPIRLLLQRLGDDDPGDRVRAHLDIACGADAAQLVPRHEAAGATFIHPGRVWSTLADPAGLEYCLTQRDPVTGRVQF